MKGAKDLGGSSPPSSLHVNPPSNLKSLFWNSIFESTVQDTEKRTDDMFNVSLNKNTVFFVALVLAFLLFTLLRWPGQLPYGSDTDEHLLVARTMLETGHFTVRDIHGTKYPPVISGLIIIFYLVGLDSGFFMVLANCCFLLSVSLLWSWYIRKQYNNNWLGGIVALYIMSNVILWDSVHLIIADTLFVFFVTIVLLISLQFEQWKWQHVLFALVVVIVASMVRSVGVVLSVPIIISIWESKNWKLNRFSIISATLIGCSPFVALMLYMLYQKQFGTHPTGYLETFLLLDPYDSSKGVVTWYGFFGRTYNHAISTAIDIGRTIVSDLPAISSTIQLLYFIFAVIIIIASCIRSRRQMSIILSFVFAYSAILSLWPYSGARFALPFIPVAALGLAEICSYISTRLPGAARVSLILFVGYLGMNMTSMAKSAQYQKSNRAEVHKEFEDLTNWCIKHIPADEVIASFDYREHSLRLNRSVLPLYYSSDLHAHISYLTQNRASWLIISNAIYYLRGVYGYSLVHYLGDKAQLTFKNKLFEVYRLNCLSENVKNDSLTMPNNVLQLTPWGAGQTQR
jgi:hypothetical protein